jgi:hypothetical protein
MPFRASQIAVLAGGDLVNMDGSEGWMRVSCGLGGCQCGPLDASGCALRSTTSVGAREVTQLPRGRLVVSHHQV